MSEHSRRTVVRGAAWSVPVIAVAAQAPAFAGSPPPPVPPPGVGIDNSCANVGTAKKGCGILPNGTASPLSDDNTLQVPVTVTNTSSVPIVFQVQSMYTINNTASAPTATTPGVTSGIKGIVVTNSTFTEDTCTTATQSNCTGGLTNGSVVVAANTTAYFFIISASTGSASNFQATITSRLLSTSPGCLPIAGTTATKSTSEAISNNNCR